MGAAAALAARARLALLSLTSLATLLAFAAMAYELTVARIPEHRLALEELIRHETGLNVGFSTLSVRWGWYGPEAVFHDVALQEGDAQRRLLSAARLRVSLDLWRMARSGRLEAGRIMLDEPQIDLGPGPDAPARTARAGEARATLLQAATRVLSRWRGGEIDIRDGMLRAQWDGRSVALRIRYAQLWHLERQWSGSAQLALPGNPGTRAHLFLAMHGDPALAELSSGTLGFAGEGLEFQALRPLLPQELAVHYLPQGGRGSLSLHAEFARGRVLSAEGRLLAQPLEWRVADPSGAERVLRVARLAAHWQLRRQGGEWHFSAAPLELGPAGTAPAALSIDLAADGTRARGVLTRAPLAALATLGQAAAPQLPPAAFSLTGEAQAVSFDWDARRPRPERLALSGALSEVRLAGRAGDVALAGLAGRLSWTLGELYAELHSEAARLTVARPGAPVSIAPLHIGARLRLTGDGQAWQLVADELEIARRDMTFSARGSIAADSARAPTIDAHLSVRNADAALVAALAAAGPAQLDAGRIDSAEVSWRGPLAQPPWSAAAAQFAGAATVSGAGLGASRDWPAISGIDARLKWRGAHGHADIGQAQSGALHLSAASAEWDARAGVPLRFTGTLAWEAAQALGWLRAHPELAPWAPALAGIDLTGALRADLSVSVRAALAPRIRLAAHLENASLRALAGVPPIDGLRGTLAFDGGHLQHAVLSAQWLGGPVSLSVSERRAHGDSGVTILGHGVMDARHTWLAAGADAQDAPLAGSTEWSALLTFMPGAGGTHWQLRADSALAGVASHLPEPFAKPAAAALPLHLELAGDAALGRLQLSLGERVRAVAELSREADTWRIERGALQLDSAVPTLPAEPVVEVSGSLSRLDLPAALALLRRAGADAALPGLRARLYAGTLLTGTRGYPAVTLSAQVAPAGGELRLTSDRLSGAASWPGQIDAAHPASVHLSGFDLVQGTDLTLAAGIAAVFAPAVRLTVDVLTLGGRPLGTFGALLASHDEVFDAHALTLRGAGSVAEGAARCEGGSCRLDFSLDSSDAAALLSAFGLKPELDAGRARFSGALAWSAQSQVPLATLAGQLHMQLQDGAMRTPADTAGTPFGVLVVPALLAALGPEAAASGTARPLRFTRLAADYELADGVATTRNLHFDGDAEILVRGRVGLAAADYDLQAWILRGEDRLPAAVRGLAPTPPVAAAWLSLRELLGAAHERTGSALHLRGTWNDPIVMPEG